MLSNLTQVTTYQYKSYTGRDLQLSNQAQVTNYLSEIKHRSLTTTVKSNTGRDLLLSNLTQVTTC